MKPAIFLDRDGTLNEERHYLHRPEDVILTPGAGPAIARLNQLGIPVIVITNQAGIAKGRFTWEAYETVSQRIQALLAQAGAHVDATYACPFHPDGKAPYQHPDHPDRKPNPGMLLKAAEAHGIDLPLSWMIGDKPIDLEAGKRAQCRTALVRTGYGANVNPRLAHVVADNLAEAIAMIIEKYDSLS